MPKCNLTEEQIIAGLKDIDNESHKSRTERCLYLDEGINKSIKGYVQNNGGNWEQANMVFNDAFEIFTSKVRLGTYPDSSRKDNDKALAKAARSSPPGTNPDSSGKDNDWKKMMMGIAKLRWLNEKYNQRNRPTMKEWKEGFDPFSPICDADADLQYDSLLDMIGSPDSDCRFIFERLVGGFDQKEIADLLSVKHGEPITYDSLRQMLVKCRKEIRGKW